MSLVTPKREVVSALYHAMKPIAERSQAVEVIAACLSMIGFLLLHSSSDLPSALDNVDRISADMKAFLRHKMGN